MRITNWSSWSSAVGLDTNAQFFHCPEARLSKDFTWTKRKLTECQIDRSLNPKEANLISTVGICWSNIWKWQSLVLDIVGCCRKILRSEFAPTSIVEVRILFCPSDGVKRCQEQTESRHRTKVPSRNSTPRSRCLGSPHPTTVWHQGTLTGGDGSFKECFSESQTVWFLYIFNKQTTSLFPFFPESACEGFFSKKQPLYYIFKPSQLLIYIFTLSHLLIYIFTLSHLLIYIFTPSHLPIYIFTPSYLLIYICWSTSSHLHICWSTSSHFHACSSTSSHSHICWDRKSVV